MPGEKSKGSIQLWLKMVSMLALRSLKVVYVAQCWDHGFWCPSEIAAEKCGCSRSSYLGYPHCPCAIFQNDSHLPFSFGAGLELVEYIHLPKVLWPPRV